MILVLAVLTVVVACGGGGQNLAEDPVSLADLSGLGGGSYEDLDPVVAAARSQTAVEVEITDIEKTHLNTADGRFPSADQLEGRGIGDLTALTDVEVTVTEELAGNGTEFEPGDIVTITVGGGLYQTDLDSRQAEILGVTGEGPVPFSWGSSPGGLVFAEGDNLVLFLVEFPIPGFDTDEIIALGPIHPNGVLVEGEDEWVVQATSAPVDLEAMLAAVGTATE